MWPVSRPGRHACTVGLMSVHTLARCAPWSEYSRTAVLATNCDAPLIVTLPPSLSVPPSVPVTLSGQVSVASGCASGTTQRQSWSIASLTPQWTPTQNPAIAAAVNTTNLAVTLPSGRYDKRRLRRVSQRIAMTSDLTTIARLMGLGPRTRRPRPYDGPV